MKNSLIALIMSAFIAGGSVCAESVSSGVFGAYQIECPADSDTYISIPVTRPAEFSGIVEYVQNSASKIVAKGEPNWAVNKFVYSAGTQSNYYYVKFTSGALEGAWFNVLSNTEYALELEIGEAELSKVSAGDSFEVIPHWSLSTLFPDGGGFTPNSTRNYGGGASQLYKYTSFENGKIIAPTSKNNSATSIYYYRTYNNANSWMSGSTPKPDDIIEPNTFLFVRQPATESATISINGGVPLCATTIELANLDTEGDTDNYISVPSAVDIKLSDLTASLVDSGIFAPRVGRAYSPVDTLFVYDNSMPGKNQSATKVYYFREYNGERHWYQGSTICDSDVIKAGTAIVIRKLKTGEIEAFRGTYTPSYAEAK